MKKQAGSIFLLLFLFFLFLLEIGDLIQVYRNAATYPFGKGDLPWYYQNKSQYKNNGWMMVSGLIITFLIGFIALFRNDLKKWFFTLSALMVSYFLFHSLQVYI